MVDSEAAVLAFLTAALSPLRVVTELPADLPAEGIVEVTRISGPTGLRGAPDRALVDVDSYAQDTISARALAYQVDALMVGVDNAHTPTGTLTIRSNTGPAVRPYADTNVRRYGGSYTCYAS